MKYWSRTLVLLLIVSSIAVAQTPDTLWTRTFGGSNTDIAWSVQETSDQGFIIAGVSYSPGLSDVCLIRTNSLGDTLWTRYFGGIYGDEGYDVKETYDGGFVTAGVYQWGSGDYRVYLIKVNANGDSLWTKTYGYGVTAGANALDITPDQGFIIAASSFINPNVDIWILKTDSLGDTLWTRRYDFTTWDEARDIKVLSDGNFIITGIVGVGGLWDAFLMKMTSNGDTLWTQFYGGPENELINSVVPTYDDGYILTGYTRSYGAGSEDIWLIKTDSLGDTLWTKTFGGSFLDSGFDVIQSTDSNYCIAANRELYSDSVALYIFKVNTEGDTLWTYHSWGMGQACATSIQQCHDQGYIIAGITKPIGSAPDDVYVVRLGTEQRITEKQSESIVTWPLRSTVYVGPLRAPDNLSYKIFNITGRQIHTLNPAPGIYFLQIDGKIKQKIIKIK
ncbi:MAG: hypothetical protein WBB67_09045 [bacterium]